MNNYGDHFQQKSKYIRSQLPRHVLNWAEKPETYKTYPSAIKTISLPKPEIDENIKFWKVLFNRKSFNWFYKGYHSNYRHDRLFSSSSPFTITRVKCR